MTRDAINTKTLMISVPLSINALMIALCVSLLCGGALLPSVWTDKSRRHPANQDPIGG